MNDEEFGRLAALWQDDADPAETREAERLAARARRRGRFMQAIELAGGAACGAGIVIALWLRPVSPALPVGAALLLALGYSVWQRHRLAGIALLAEGQERGRFLRNLARARRAAARRAWLGLLLFLPTLLLATLFLYLRESGAPDGFGTFLAFRLTTPRGIAVAGAATVVLVWLWRNARLLGAQAGRLERLARHYEADDLP